MKLQFMLLLVTLAFCLGQSPAQEPLRAGIDVPEPNLIKKVAVTYPEDLKIEGLGGHAVVKMLIDEQGAVADVTLGHDNTDFRTLLLKAVESAAKEWRFSPTFVDGKAVPVTATVVILFTLGYPPLYTVDLAAYPVFQYRDMTLGNSVTLCTFSVTMDRDGNLKESSSDDIMVQWDPDGRNREEISRKEMCRTHKYFVLFPEPDVPFSRIEEQLKVHGPPVTFLRLQTPQYRFPHSRFIENERPGLARLYYSVPIISNGSQLIQLAGVDPDVKPPKFNLDFDRLAESLKDSHYKNGAIHFFTVFVDEAGSILGIEYSDTKNEAVITALSKAHVLTPGMRDGVPVPTAVILAIPVK